MSASKKITKKWEWIAVIGFLGYLIYQKKQESGAFGGLPNGYKVKIDPSMAVDIITGPFELSPTVRLVIKQGVNGLVNKFSRYGIENSHLKRF